MSISVNKTLWLLAILLTLAAVFVLASGDVEQLFRSFITDQSTSHPPVRQKISVAERLPATRESGTDSASADSAGEITRIYYKPSHSGPAEAIRLEISAVEQNSELLIVGRLFDGSACNRLQIDLDLEGNDGRKVFHTLILALTGNAGDRPIQSKRRLPPSAVESPTVWKAHVAALRCLDP